MRQTMLAALTCVLVVACASEDSADTTEAAEPAETTAATEATAAPDTTMAATTEADTEESGGATITMENISYSGASSVEVGETLELVNNDEVPHTFTDEDDSFDVSISAGDNATYTFEEPGEYSYFCTIHPSMSGTITVEG